MKENKQQRAEEIAAQRQKAEQARREAEKKQTRKWVLPIAIAAVVLCAAAIVAAVLGNIDPENKALRQVTVAQSEHFTVDGAMMKYWISNYESTLSAQGVTLEEGKKLSEQTVDGESILSYITPAVQEEVTRYLARAEGALAAGETVSEQQKTVMQTQADNMESLPDGVSAEDVTNCTIITYLAGKYEEQFSSLSFTEQEMKTYGKDNPTECKAVDGICYSIAYDATDGTSVKTARDLAQSCLTKGTFEDFLNQLSAVAAKINGCTAQEQKAVFEEAISRGVAYTDDAFGEWAFSEDRRDGDCTVIQYEAGSCYLVYGLEKAPYFDEGETVTLYKTEFSASVYGTAEKAEKRAQTLIKAFEEGEKTQEQFAKLAYMYNFMSADNREGYYENVSATTLGQDVASWTAQAGRQTGDYELLTTDEGCCVVYFVGAGLPVWQGKATDGLRAQKLEEAESQYTGTVTFDAETLNKLGL